jgi:hypothetical protein
MGKCSSQELSNNDIVVYAIFKLGGIEKKVHTEDIAMECFRLSPERFSWTMQKYFKKFPDKEIARITLKNLKHVKDKNVRLVDGRAGAPATGKETDGWRLTPEGVKWILSNKKRIEKALKIGDKTVRRPDIRNIIKKFENEICYQKYLQEGSVKNVNKYEFTDMLLCRPDAAPEVISKNFQRLKAQAELTQDKSILSFISECEQAFKELMT